MIVPSAKLLDSWHGGRFAARKMSQFGNQKRIFPQKNGIAETMSGVGATPSQIPAIPCFDMGLSGAIAEIPVKITVADP